MNVILGRQLDANYCLKLVWRNSRVPMTHLFSVVQSSRGLEFNLISNKIFGPHSMPICTSSTFHTSSKLAAYIGNSSKRQSLSEDLRNKHDDEIQVVHEDGQSDKKRMSRTKINMLYLMIRPGFYRRSTPVETFSYQNPKPFSFFDETQYKDKLNEGPAVKEYKAELQPSNTGKLRHSFPKSLVTQIEITPDSTKRKRSRKHEVKQHPDMVKLINIKYPFRNRSKDVPVKTVNFKECQLFLKSQGIPYDELEYYPDVQMMSKNEILECILKLKEHNIHNVFSLFLIRRIYLEMSLEMPCRADMKKRKNGIRRLCSLRTVQDYLELCQILNKPDLDIRGLMDKLAELGNSDDLFVILKKVKRLQSVGATSEDILNNLELLLGYEFFYEKIELYEKTLLHTTLPHFPVKLFFAKKLNTFKEQLALGDEIQEMANMLGVSLTEFQACWGFRIHNTVELKYKIQMCLNAGISKQDIFNHLKMLDTFPVEKCHAATTCFRTSGLPASVYVLHHMESTLEMNGGTHAACDETTDSSSDWTCHVGNVSPTLPSSKKSKVQLGKTMLSTKRLRRQIFFMISNLLKLDNRTVTTMYESGIDVSSTDVQDIAKNLDFLQLTGFTKEQIAAFPLILAHSNKKLIRVAGEAKDRVRSSLLSSSLLPQASPVADVHTGALPNTVSPSQEQVSPLSPDMLMGNDPSSEDFLVAEVLFASPERHLNTLQYLLEKENSFSLASPDGQKVSGFIHLTA
ncbi:unnamed protein product [Lymnaea stagnalis]|uniref:Transcription termination factor 4, mitochondrial n=1 Tax=Lymnaea stagnalis TaxID=6523 RepID=A0AAV2IHW4_LYMST